MAGLIIFIKRPILGQVKTRLAATVGPQKALDIYRQLLSRTREACLSVSTRRYLYYMDRIDHDDAWESTHFSKRSQVDGDLGAKMYTAFQEVLAQEDSAIIIGSDCPDIDGKALSAAQRALEDYDMVIGPTLDGGYYLLGLRSAHPQLFTDMPWSTGLEYEESLRRAIALGYKVLILPRLRDIDRESDWIAWLDSQKDS